MYEFKLPSLGADMEDGVLLEWKVKPGDIVKKGDIVAVIDTVKAAIDIEIFVNGKIESILVPADREKKIPVGTVLALLSESDEDAASARPRTATAAQPSGAFDKKLSMRQGIASAMSLSWREIPHYYLRTEVDMSACLERLREENEKRAIADRILPASLIIKAVACALVNAPEFNGYFLNGAFQPGNGIHIGMAVALREGGLIAPAIKNCNNISFINIMNIINDLAGRVRNLNLTGSEMTDATITVTSLDDPGAQTIFGIIRPPQVALIGCGRISERAVSIEGRIVSREMMDLTLSGDHRQTDGRQGAAFLGEIKELLEMPDDIFDAETRREEQV